MAREEFMVDWSEIYKKMETLLTGEHGWLAEISLLIAGAILIHLVLHPLVDRLCRRLEKGKAGMVTQIFHATINPLKAFVWLMVGTRLVQVGLAVEEVDEARVVISLGCFTLFFLNWKNLFIQHIGRKRGARKGQLDLKVISKASSVAIVGIGLMFILDALGYSIAALLAVGGVGGIALAFAAQDLIANFFGGILIYSTRPFREGEMVSIPEKNVDGWVEEIGWYMTRLKNFERRPVFIPNAAFAKALVVNVTRQTNRRITISIGIRYEDATLVPKILSDIRAYLSKQERLDQEISPLINLDRFDTYFLGIELMAFTPPVALAEFREIKEEILLEMSKIVKGHGAQFAFPTTTLEAPKGITVWPPKGS